MSHSSGINSANCAFENHIMSENDVNTAHMFMFSAYGFLSSQGIKKLRFTRQALKSEIFSQHSMRFYSICLLRICDCVHAVPRNQPDFTVVTGQI